MNSCFLVAVGLVSCRQSIVKITLNYAKPLENVRNVSEYDQIEKNDCNKTVFILTNIFIPHSSLHTSQHFISLMFCIFSLANYHVAFEVSFKFHSSYYCFSSQATLIHSNFHSSTFKKKPRYCPALCNYIFELQSLFFLSHRSDE